MISFGVLLNGQRKTVGFSPLTGRETWPEIQKIEAAARDIRPALPRVHEIMLAIEEQIFETQGRSIGRPWPDYQPREQFYIDYKAKKFGSAYPMMQLGPKNKQRLRPSLTNAGNSEHIWIEQPHGFIFGTSVPYALGNHEGTGDGWVPRWARNKAHMAYTVPKRELIGMTPRTIGDVVKVIQGYIFGSATGPKNQRGGYWK